MKAIVNTILYTGNYLACFFLIITTSNIPEPTEFTGLNYQDFSATVRDEYKKFKKEYLEPVQLRYNKVFSF